MPLKLDCGLSRKIGEANYGSRGASINFEMELDSGIIAEPAKLQERIRQLFSQIRTSLTEELNGGNGQASPETRNTSEPATAPVQGGNAKSGNNGQPNARRPATQSQVKAIIRIAQKQQLDLASFLQSNFGVRQPQDLDIKAASQVIDALKSGGAERRAA